MGTGSITRLIVGAASIALFAACGAGDTPEAPTSKEVMRDLPDTPVLKFDKEAVELKGIAKDQETVQTFLVINRGGAPLQVGSVQVQMTEGCDVVEVSNESMEVPVGKADLLFVKFGEHHDTGSHEAKLTVPSNDPSRPWTTLFVRFDVEEPPKALAEGPRLRIDRHAIDIGPVPFDWPLYEEFTLLNEGDRDLVIEGEPQIRVVEGC